MSLGTRATGTSPTGARWVIASGVTVYRPGSDVIVGGWTASTGGSLASCIDEAVLDRADFITSPDLSSPSTLTWGTPIPAGYTDIKVDGTRLGAGGQLRIVLLDVGGAQVGITPWWTVPATDTTNIFTGIAVSALSTQFRIEVQP